MPLFSTWIAEETYLTIVIPYTTTIQVHYLVAGANGVRKLIRVKIADDNDLQQAETALKSTDMFFKALYHRAKEANIAPYKLLKMADTFQP